jgi:hypothetical protein
MKMLWSGLSKLSVIVRMRGFAEKGAFQSARGNFSHLMTKFQLFRMLPSPWLL